jgi:hypothetical protein
MNSKKETYLIISEDQDPTLSFGEAIRSTCATASNFKKAYDIALSLSGITNPSPGYRASLERVNREWATEVKERFGSTKVTIALVKKY